jgi:hypothetical protein
MLLMRANPLGGQVGGGWALEIETYLGPVKWYQADRRIPFGAQKVEIFLISQRRESYMRCCQLHSLLPSALKVGYSRI